MEQSLLSQRLKELRKVNNYTQDYVAVVYEAPGPSKTSEDLSAYLEYFNDPRNQKKFQYNSNLEKELLYYFQMISDHDKREIIELYSDLCKPVKGGNGRGKKKK